MMKKKPIFDALPKLNIPQRTSIKRKSFERPYRSIVNENPYIPSSSAYIYHSYKEFCDRVSKLKTLNDWNVTLLSDRILIHFFTKPITAVLNNC